MSRSSPSFNRVHFETSSSENEEDYVLYQRLDGNGCPINNDIIRIPSSQAFTFCFIEKPRSQPCHSSISRAPVAICFPHSSKNNLEYQHRNSMFLARLHRMMIDELLHQNEYIEKLEAQVHSLSTKLARQQLENEKLMSQKRMHKEDKQFMGLKNTINVLPEQLDLIKAEYDKIYCVRQQAQKMTNGNTKAAEVVEILKKTAGSDDDHLEDTEVSTCSERTDIIEDIKSNSGHLFERNESQRPSESDSASCDQKTYKSELTVDEAIHHSLNYDFENDENVCNEILPMSNNYFEDGYAPSDSDRRQPSVNQVIHNHFNINVTIPNINCINRSKVSRSKITQEQRSAKKTYSYHAKPSKKDSTTQVIADSNRAMKSRDKPPSNQEDRYKYVIIRKPRKLLQRRESVPINEEPQNDDSDTSLKTDTSIKSGDISEDEGNQEVDESEDENHRSLQGNQNEYVPINEEPQEEDDDSDTILKTDTSIKSGDISEEEGNQGGGESKSGDLGKWDFRTSKKERVDKKDLSMTATNKNTMGKKAKNLQINQIVRQRIGQMS